MDSFSYIFPYNNLVVNSTGLFNITFPLVHLQLRMLVTLTIIINQEITILGHEGTIKKLVCTISAEEMVC